MAKTKNIPQETVMEKKDVSDAEGLNDVDLENESIPKTPEEIDELFENWPELQKILNNVHTVEELFELGWRLNQKIKPSGKRYMSLRITGKDPKSGKNIDRERGLGPFNQVKWDILQSLDPKLKLPEVIRRDDWSSQDLQNNQYELQNSQEPQETPSESTMSKRASVLTTKVARVAPIGPSVQINLGTLQWYTWTQQVCGYTGTLDNFINDTVESYFRNYHHLELAVVVKGDESN